MQPFTYPTPAELYALEQSARRARSLAQARLARAAFASLKSMVVRLFALRGPSAHAVNRQVARHA
jgi:hypothetical protein